MKGKFIRLMILPVICLASMAVSVSAQEPLNISSIRQFEYNWHAGVNDVCIQGSYAYLACQNEGMRLINIAQPGSYYIAVHLDLGYTAAVAVSGDYAYLGDPYTRVSIVDISVKTAPVEVASIPITGSIYNIRIFGHYAYFCTTDGLIVADISNPAEPSIVWRLVCQEVMDVTVRDNKAYLTSVYTGLEVYDITDLSAPVFVDRYQLNDGNVIVGVSLFGNYAVLAAGWDGFRIVDLTTMEMVSEIDSLKFAQWVKVSGDYAYLAYGYPECPLAIINISDPLLPQLASVYYPPEDIANFTIVDNTVYVADSRHGLRTVDVSDPANPIESVGYNRFGFDKKVAVEGTLAFALSTFKLTAIDIADPVSPQEFGNFEGNWEFSDFKIAGNIAYVLSGEPTVLYSVNFSDPSSPTLLDQIEPESYYRYYRIALYDHYLYLLGWDEIVIYNISDPEQISMVGSYEIGTYGTFIYAFGHYAMVQDRDQNLTLLDLQNPIEPTIASTFWINGRCYDARANDNTLFAITNNKLMVFDISVISRWRLLLSKDIGIDGNYEGHHLDLDNNLLYLASEGYGLVVYDITSPVSPEIVGYFDTPGSAHGVAVSGNMVVVADHTNLGIYDYADAQGAGDPMETNLPEFITLLPNYPNPFNSSTLIRFELGARSSVSISVLDLLGRQVAVLADGVYEPGQHSIRWDGSGMNGQVVSSGHYYVRAQSGAFSRSLPVTLLK